MFACRHCWDHTLCFIHKQLPVSENLESESLSALSYYHLWAWLPPQLHNGISSMLSWMLWESSVITFVKDLGHRLCSRNVVPHFVNPPIGAERDGIWLNSFSCHCFLFLPQLFKLWHHFINMFFSFLRSIELPQELLKHLNANHMFLVLLWSKRQPMTPRFYMLGMIFCSGQLGHLMWRLTWLCICTCEDFHGCEPCAGHRVLVTWQCQKGLYFFSFYTYLLVFFMVISLSTFKWGHLLICKGRRKCSVEMFTI